MKEGWEKYSLMDICNVTTGKHDANHAEINGKYRFYTCSSQYVYCNTKRYEGECIILPGNGINVGESYYYNGEFDAYQRTYVIDKIDKRIIPMYLFYHLQNNWKSEGVAKQYGSATNYIKIGNFKDYIVKMPQSLSEQQSIVDYLDSAFAKIDAMKANAEKALIEAKALFQASLKEMLEPKEGWEEKNLGDICEIIRGKRFVRTDIIENGVPCIHYGDIYTHYGLSVKKTRGCINPELAKKMRFAEKNDVVVVQAGENNWDIGVGVAYFGEEPAAVHDACFILKHKQDPMYISYYLRSYNYHRYLVDYVHEGKICSFLKPALENAPIPLPPFSEQQSIVATLDSLKSKVDRLQENYDKISQECDALKQAILRQVFE